MRVFLQFTRNTINNKKHLNTICDFNNIPKSILGIIFNQHAENLNNENLLGLNFHLTSENLDAFERGK